MPLTKTGKKVLRSFQRQYGKEVGEDYFYASLNKGILPRHKLEKGYYKKRK